MDLFNEKSKYIIEKEVKYQTIDKIEEDLTELNKIEIAKPAKVIIEEEQAAKDADKDAWRRKMIFPIFKELAGEEMSEDEYKLYIHNLESEETKKGYNLAEFIEDLKGDIKDEEYPAHQSFLRKENAIDEDEDIISKIIDKLAEKELI